MNTFELALKMGKEGEKFYRQLADQASNSGFRGFFNQLADEEVKHCRSLEDIQHPLELFKGTTISRDVGNILKQAFIKDGLRDLEISRLDLYQEAMKHAQERQNFFHRNAVGTADENQRELFQKIAAEEEKHYFWLYNICELMSVEKELSQIPFRKSLV